LTDKPKTEAPSQPVTIPGSKPDIKPKPNDKPNPVLPLPVTPPGTQTDKDDDDDEYIYRGGNPGNANLTPRPKNDTEGPKRGLSTFTTAKRAKEMSGKPTATKISVKALRAQGLTVDYIGDHASIRPATQEELEKWAATKQDAIAGKDPHMYTKQVQAAVRGVE